VNKDEIILKLSAEVQELKRLLGAALVRISELESQLNSNSKNSSRPPSSDLVKPKRSTGLPKKKKDKGGQKGHDGATLKMVAHPDEKEQLRPDRCACGKRLLRQDMVVHARRQVFDLPEPKLEVKEYQQMSCCCPGCGEINLGKFPDFAKAPVQYGNGVRALVNLLSIKCHLSYQNIKELFADLFEHPINDATIQSALIQANVECEDVEQSIKEQLFASANIHGDETGLQIKNKRQWLHVLCNDKWTYLFTHERRGSKALESCAPELFNYKGNLVHDCWSSYWKVKSASHSLCNPHFLRELTAQIEQGRKWAIQMHGLLMEMYQIYNKEEQIHRRSYAWRKYQAICRAAFEEEPPPTKSKRGRPKKSKGRNLAERLFNYQTEVLRFVLEEDIPFSNNQAERDLRPAKGKQKVAGCFRTQHGAQRYARLQGVFSTWRKQGYNVFRSLKAILDGQQFSFG
jgi:transposase